MANPRNEVKRNGSDIPNGLPKGTGEIASEIGNRRLNTGVAKNTNTTCRLRPGEELRILVENSSNTATATLDETGAGVGLQNVRRRLEICYGPGATLRLAPDQQKTTAEICIPLAAR